MRTADSHCGSNEMQESTCEMLVPQGINLSLKPRKKPTKSQRLKKKKAIEQSKTDNYDDTIWDTNADASELYFPIMISEKLKKESKRRKPFESPPKLNYAFKSARTSEAFNPHSVKYEETPNLDTARPEPALIVTTGAFTIEGGITLEPSAAELPPHTVCIVNCFHSSTKEKIRKELSRFGEVTDVLLYSMSRPPVAYVTFCSKAACKACTSAGIQGLPESNIFSSSNVVQCRQKKLTEAEAREASGSRQLQLFKKKYYSRAKSVDC